MLAFIDIETGGFSKTKNGLCEVAVVIAQPDYVVTEIISLLVKPYLRDCETELVSYKPDAMEIHGITLDRLEAEGQDITVVLSQVVALLEKHGVTEIYGHNSHTFDFPWLDYLVERFLGQALCTAERFDTMKIAKDTVKCGSYKLEHLCEFLGIDIDHTAKHTARGDALTTLQLLRYLRSGDALKISHEQ